MSTFWSRLLAVVEVIAVFIVTRLVIGLWLIPALGLDGKEWGTRFLVYALWIAVALLMVLVHRPIHRPARPGRARRTRGAPGRDLRLVL